MIDFFVIRVLLSEKGMYPKMSLHIWRRRRRWRRGLAGKVNILSHPWKKEKKKAPTFSFGVTTQCKQKKEKDF